MNETPSPSSVGPALPDRLRAAIEVRLEGVDRARLDASAARLSAAYRADGAGASRAAVTADEVAAYLATRAPATYAAAVSVLTRVRAQRPGWTPASVLDLGAGPGVASWAAASVWPAIGRFTLVEAEPGMVAAGRALAGSSGEALARAAWIQGDAAEPVSERAELVVASYLLGELDSGEVASVARHGWAHCADTVVFLEPGTTAGYRRALAARAAVLAQGGHTQAPCPHDGECPLPAGDWCHFAARLPRSRTHRAVKRAERGFEDEKFAYAVLARAPNDKAAARILRRPQLNPGHVVLELCAPEGLERRTITRRDKERYRRARKLGWGDTV